MMLTDRFHNDPEVYASLHRDNQIKWIEGIIKDGISRRPYHETHLVNESITVLLGLYETATIKFKPKIS